MNPPVEAPTSRHDRPAGIEAEVIEGRGELHASARDVGMRRARRPRPRRLPSTPSPAFSARRPSTDTRPARIIACAFSRVGARPRATRRRSSRARSKRDRHLHRALELRAHARTPPRRRSTGNRWETRSSTRTCRRAMRSRASARVVGTAGVRGNDRDLPKVEIEETGAPRLPRRGHREEEERAARRDGVERLFDDGALARADEDDVEAATARCVARPLGSTRRETSITASAPLAARRARGARPRGRRRRSPRLRERVPCGRRAGPPGRAPRRAGTGRGRTAPRRNALTTVASGSTKLASSSVTPSGIRGVSRARLPAGIRTSSAMPPGSSRDERQSGQWT